MNKIQPITIPLSIAIRLISKMIKISNITVTIPYINPHTNIQDKLELKIKSDNNDKNN